LAAGTIGTPALPASKKTTDLSAPETVSLCGQWWFRTDSGNIGAEQRWYGTDDSISAWRKVSVPHTWQVDASFVDYRGVAWYRRIFEAPSEWQNSAVRIEFEAVFHTATIWVNGELAGEHVRKGYTAFVLDKFERELLVLVTETQRE
jgi:beta-glucuronidase